MDTWYIAEGRLHRCQGDGAAREVLSPFVQEALARNERSRQLDGWKTARPDDDGGRMVSRATLWGAGGSGGGTLVHRFTHVTRGDEGSVYYVVFLGNGTALFRYFPGEEREVRLFHGASMRCLGLAYDPASRQIVFAAGNADGTACLEMIDGEGRRRGTVTGGDAIDASPSLSAREPGVVYYQSSGVARHAQSGHTVAIGPAALLRLDTRTAQLSTVLEHRDFDYLAPREDASGNLWYIRRPFEKSAGEVAYDAGKSALLFPWRVAKGVFGFLDAFSKVYGREPMKPGGGPQNHNLKPDLGALWLHGRMVAIEQARYDNGRGGGLVPSSWELVCRNAKGQDYVAARHVVTFDVAPDGSVAYSNGYGIYRLDDGEWRQTASANLVESVCA